jgi:RanBP1 domain
MLAFHTVTLSFQQLSSLHVPVHSLVFTCSNPPPPSLSLSLSLSVCLSVTTIPILLLTLLASNTEASWSGGWSGGNDGASESTSASASTASAWNTGDSSTSTTDDGGWSWGDSGATETVDWQTTADSTDDPGSESVQSPFKEKKEQGTGEENDTIHFKARCKVFQLVDNAWKECSIGELHANTTQVDGKTSGRLVLRNDRTKRLVLNAPVLADSTPPTLAKKSVVFSTVVDTSVVSSYTLKFKTEKQAKECEAAIIKIRGLLAQSKETQ